MTSTTGRIALVLATTILASSSMAWAEDTCHGYSIGTGKDRRLIHLLGSVPMHLASGECGAASPDGETNMMSECVYTDHDGDRWTSRNSWVKSTPEGTWCNVGGTGKYLKVMGGCGWWKALRTGPLNVWEFGGQCVLAPIQ